ncbi:MAG: DUF4838 domain-containing protein [Clostridia bacterium]|nr:DUF4838 domain-containing protein [Clostridia bacterium]
MKKLLAVLVCLCMLCSSLAVLTGAAEFVYDQSFTLGDANGDGSINAKDALAVKARVALVDGYECNTDAADIDADGSVTAKDSFYLKSQFVGRFDISSVDSANQVYKFTIAGNEISNYKIQLPADAVYNDNVHFAAELLQRYIRIATGYNPAIVKGTVSGPAIVLNAVDLDSEQGQELGIEGYIYEVKDGNLNIYGTYRGNMYAAYEIIEDYLGFRFYDDDYIFSYKSRVVDIPDGTYRFVYPEVPIRNVRAHFGNKEEHTLALHINSTDHGSSTDIRHGTMAGSQFINAHSFGYYWQMGTGEMPPEGTLNDKGKVMTLEERYVAKYNSGEVQDEYNWQPCASSAEAYDILFQGMLDTIARIINWGSYDFSPEKIKLGILSMSFSGNDNIEFCKCKYCVGKAQGNRIRTNTTFRETSLPYYSGAYELGSDNYVQFQKEGYSGVYIDLANHAARDIQEYYPGLRLHSILYDHDVPASVRPEQWLNVWYCGSGCNNHWLGSNECSEKGGQLKYSHGDLKGKGWSNRIDEVSLVEWGKFCKESGAQLWFWYYPVTYHYYLAGCPNIFNIYYDYKFLVEKCGVTNLFYEGGGKAYNFEKLKGYLAARMAWDPGMSFETYVGHIKEYLYMYYGDGYEEMYQYLVMQNEAGDQCGTCFVNNYDRPGDMYSLEYLAEHYEEMRALLCTAEDKATRSEYKQRIKTMKYCFDWLGLSAVYKEWYVNGTEEQKALYVERYTDMFNYFHEINITIFSSDVYVLPSEMDFTVDPMTQFYEDGSRRPDSAWGN